MPSEANTRNFQTRHKRKFAYYIHLARRKQKKNHNIYITTLTYLVDYSIVIKKNMLIFQFHGKKL